MSSTPRGPGPRLTGAMIAPLFGIALTIAAHPNLSPASRRPAADLLPRSAPSAGSRFVLGPLDEWHVFGRRH